MEQAAEAEKARESKNQIRVKEDQHKEELHQLELLSRLVKIQGRYTALDVSSEMQKFKANAEKRKD